MDGDDDDDGRIAKLVRATRSDDSGGEIWQLSGRGGENASHKSS